MITFVSNVFTSHAKSLGMIEEYSTIQFTNEMRSLLMCARCLSDCVPVTKFQTTDTIIRTVTNCYGSLLAVGSIGRAQQKRPNNNNFIGAPLMDGGNECAFFHRGLRLNVSRYQKRKFTNDKKKHNEKKNKISIKSSICSDQNRRKRHTHSAKGTLSLANLH